MDTNRTDSNGGPAAEHRVGLMLDARGPRAEEALDGLREALDGAEVGEVDGNGIFEVTMPADSFEAALGRVWNAVAAAGVDDRLRFTEHPDLPEHWRARPG
jgi:hypothetical protein